MKKRSKKHNRATKTKNSDQKTARRKKKRSTTKNKRGGIALWKFHLKKDDAELTKWEDQCWAILRGNVMYSNDIAGLLTTPFSMEDFLDVFEDSISAEVNLNMKKIYKTRKKIATTRIAEFIQNHIELKFPENSKMKTIQRVFKPTKKVSRGRKSIQTETEESSDGSREEKDSSHHRKLKKKKNHKRKKKKRKQYKKTTVKFPDSCENKEKRVRLNNTQPQNLKMVFNSCRPGMMSQSNKCSAFIQTNEKKYLEDGNVENQQNTMREGINKTEESESQKSQTESQDKNGLKIIPNRTNSEHGEAEERNLLKSIDTIKSENCENEAELIPKAIKDKETENRSQKEESNIPPNPKPNAKMERDHPNHLKSNQSLISETGPEKSRTDRRSQEDEYEPKQTNIESKTKMKKQKKPKLKIESEMSEIEIQKMIQKKIIKNLENYSNLKSFARDLKKKSKIPKKTILFHASQMNGELIFKFASQIILLKNILRPFAPKTFKKYFFRILFGLEKDFSKFRSVVENLKKEQSLLAKYLYFLLSDSQVGQIIDFPLNWTELEHKSFDIYLKKSGSSGVSKAQCRDSKAAQSGYLQNILNSGNIEYVRVLIRENRNSEYLLSIVDSWAIPANALREQNDHQISSNVQDTSQGTDDVRIKDLLLASLSLPAPKSDSSDFTTNRPDNIDTTQPDLLTFHLPYLAKMLETDPILHKASLSRFLAFSSTPIAWLLSSFCQLLMSFEFRFTLQNTNVNVFLKPNESPRSDTTHESPQFCREFDFNCAKIKISKIFKKMKQKNKETHVFARAFKHLRETYRILTQSPNPQKTPPKSYKRLQKMIQIIVLACITNIKKRQPLTAIKTWLDEQTDLQITFGFWSEHLLLQLVFNYSDFELRHLIARKLALERSMPWFLLCQARRLGDLEKIEPTEQTEVRPDQTNLENLANEQQKVENANKSNTTNDSEIHQPNNPLLLLCPPHLKLIAQNELSILSLSLGLARIFQTGKTFLLNSLFDLELETKANDPLHLTRTQLHFGRNFSPQRHLVVIDSNLEPQSALNALAPAINIVFLQILFTDLIDNFPHISKRLSEIISLCNHNQIKLFVCVRDFKDYTPFLATDLDESKFFFSLQDEVEQDCDLEMTDSSSGEEDLRPRKTRDKSEFRSLRRLRLEIKKIQKFYARNQGTKSDWTQNSEHTSKRRNQKLDLGMKNYQRLVQSLKSDFQKEFDQDLILLRIQSFLKIDESTRESSLSKMRDSLNYVVNPILQRGQESLRLNLQNLILVDNLQKELNGSPIELRPQSSQAGNMNSDNERIENLPNKILQTDVTSLKRQSPVKFVVDGKQSGIAEKIISGAQEIIQILKNCDVSADTLFPVNQILKESDNLKRKMARLDLSDHRQKRCFEGKMDEQRRSLKTLLINSLLIKFVEKLKDNEQQSMEHTYGSFLVFLDWKLAELSQQMNEIPNQDLRQSHSSWKLNTNLFWRNLLPFLLEPESDFFNKSKDKGFLISVLEQVWLKGLVFELVDGDNFQFQGQVLSLFRNINVNREVQIVGVMGPQSSGKSTLMNFMTGSDFESSSGICTKGINCYLKTQMPLTDYLTMIKNQLVSDADDFSWTSETRTASPPESGRNNSISAIQLMGGLGVNRALVSAAMGLEFINSQEYDSNLEKGKDITDNRARK